MLEQYQDDGIGRDGPVLLAHVAIEDGPG